ncbi:MAG: aldehyde dehydrogenase family protein [Lachnospiraceae bacterium]
MQNIKMFIDGEWVNSASGKKKQLVNPATGEIFAEAEEATKEDTLRAVEAAKKAFSLGSSWRNLMPQERADLVYKVADKLEERIEEIAKMESINTGKLFRETRYDDVYAAIGAFRYFAGLISEIQGSTSTMETGLFTISMREPLGVCGIIVPWNYPLGTAAVGIAQALCAGNTIVVKPSSLTPCTTSILFEIFEEVGFPKGSVNLVLGNGEVTGNAIAESRDVKKIVFTGGTVTGRELIKRSSTSVKKLALELGGKSPFIIFKDADLEVAVDNAMFGIYLSQGQNCTAGSRMLVEEPVYDKVLEILKKRVAKIKIGMPFDVDAEFGPLVSEGHMRNVLQYIKSGKEDGATLLVGGNRIQTGDFAKGYFVEPTVFADCRQEMRIVQEEIFGPVLTVQKFSNEEEAITMANDIEYGLAGGVFTQDISKAMRVCNAVNTGVLWINTYMEGNLSIPLSPHKESGLGIVGGIEGLREYTVLKQINVKINATKINWFTEEE